MFTVRGNAIYLYDLIVASGARGMFCKEIYYTRDG